MGRNYSCHQFTVIVPTRYAEDIVSRWGWEYDGDKDDRYWNEHNDHPCYFAVMSSDELGLTKFIFGSLSFWPTDKMMDDVHEISVHYQCPVLTIYDAGPDGVDAQFIVPWGDHTWIPDVKTPDYAISLKDAFSMQLEDYTSYAITDARSNQSFVPDMQLMRGKTD